mgnify:CR=1 FL=1
MELDAIWQTFAETGDPICYMLYKAAKNSPQEMNREKRAPAAQADRDDMPRSEG